MTAQLPGTMTREGAEALARKLDQFWHAQGHTNVEHWVEQLRWPTHRGPRGSEAMWVVRSNLLRGPATERERTRSVSGTDGGWREACGTDEQRGVVGWRSALASREAGFYWVILRRNDAPEVARFDGAAWWLTGEAEPQLDAAVVVVSDRLVFKPRLAPVA